MISRLSVEMSSPGTSLELEVVEADILRILFSGSGVFPASESDDSMRMAAPNGRSSASRCMLKPISSKERLNEVIGSKTTCGGLEPLVLIIG